MFPDVSLWTCELGAAWRAIWWAACWIFPLSLWCATGWCVQWRSRTWWRPSRSPPRTSCWRSCSPRPWPLPCTPRGSAGASNRHQQLETHTKQTFLCRGVACLPVKIVTKCNSDFFHLVQHRVRLPAGYKLISPSFASLPIFINPTRDLFITTKSGLVIVGTAQRQMKMVFMSFICFFL